MGAGLAYGKRAIVSAVLAVLLAGCSFSFERDGARYIVGLVDVVVVPADGMETFAGDIVTVRTLGLAFNQSSAGSNATLGYVRETTATLRNSEPTASAECPPAQSADTATVHTRQKVSARGYGTMPPVSHRGHRYVGLISVQIPLADTCLRKAGVSTLVRTAGVSHVSTAFQSDLTIGVAQTAVAVFENDVYVRGRPLGLDGLGRSRGHD